jgi:hypothetical protein
MAMPRCLSRKRLLPILVQRDGSKTERAVYRYGVTRLQVIPSQPRGCLGDIVVPSIAATTFLAGNTCNAGVVHQP